MPMPPLTGDRQYRDSVVRIAELTVNTLEIRSYSFSNCRILGPAVLIPQGHTSFIGCSFEGDLDSIFWEITPSRRVIVGAVAIVDCTFSNCKLSQIGLGGALELREMLEAGFE